MVYAFKQLNGNLRQPFIVRLKAEQHAAAMKVRLCKTFYLICCVGGVAALSESATGICACYTELFVEGAAVS